MSPEQGRSEWQLWSDRADALRLDHFRYTAMYRDAPAGSFRRHVSATLDGIIRALRFAEKHRDALREYAPRVTP